MRMHSHLNNVFDQYNVEENEAKHVTVHLVAIFRGNA